MEGESVWETLESWYEVTESVTVSCEEEYVKHGENNLKCGSHGEGIGTMPECKLIVRSLKGSMLVLPNVNEYQRLLVYGIVLHSPVN